MLFPLSSLDQSSPNLQGIHPPQRSICPWSFIMILQLDGSLCTFKTSIQGIYGVLALQKSIYAFPTFISQPILTIFAGNTSPPRVYLPLKFHHDPPTGRVTVHLQDFFFQAYVELTLQKSIYAFPTLISRPILTTFAGIHPSRRSICPWSFIMIL